MDTEAAGAEANLVTGFSESEARGLILNGASTIPEGLRREIAGGLWSRSKAGWCVVTYGHTYFLDEQGISLVFWLNWTPYVVNPAYLKGTKAGKLAPLSGDEATTDIDLDKQNDYFMGHDSGVCE